MKIFTSILATLLLWTTLAAAIGNITEWGSRTLGDKLIFSETRVYELDSASADTNSSYLFEKVIPKAEGPIKITNIKVESCDGNWDSIDILVSDDLKNATIKANYTVIDWGSDWNLNPLEKIQIETWGKEEQ